MRLSFLTAAALALLTTVGCDSSDSSDADFDFGDNDADVVVACGDSITESGYPAILAGMVGKTVVNQGFGGYRSSDGVSVVNNAIARYRPGYVLVLYGANDVIHQIDPAVTIRNLRSMVQRAKANGSIVIVGTLTPMYDNYTIYAGFVDTLNPMIVQMASEEGARIARIDRAFGNNRELILPDGLHPSEAGRIVIADSFAGRIH